VRITLAASLLLALAGPGSALGQSLALAGSGSTAARPLDLVDPRPRWVQVQFEISPADKPDQFDTVYTRKILAWLEPDPGGGQVRVTIPRRAVERDLFAPQNPVTGSFSDFVWVFDRYTGGVLRAELVGRIVKRLDWGFFETEVEADIRVAMGTDGPGGFEKPRQWFGQQLFGYCAERQRADCTIVEPRGYDADTGYVNAVGDLAVRFKGITVRTFSPLGEAVFSEIPGERPVASLETALN
jgi:hypothetical protein